MRVMNASVVYRCKAVNAILNEAFGDPRNFRFELIGRFPRTVSPASKVRPNDLRVRVTVFRAFSRRLRLELGVRKLRFKPIGLNMVARSG